MIPIGVAASIQKEQALGEVLRWYWEPSRASHRWHCTTPDRLALLPGDEWIQYTEAALAALSLGAGCAVLNGSIAVAVSQMRIAVEARFRSNSHYRQGRMFRIKRRKYKGTNKSPLNAEQYERAVFLALYEDGWLIEMLDLYGVRMPEKKEDLPKLLAAVQIERY